MAVDAWSDVEWEVDPEDNGVMADGMMESVEMRAVGDPERRVLAKFVQAPGTTYSLGMERVGYTLGVHLGLPIPETQLAVIDGRPASVQRLIRFARTFRSLKSAPMMGEDIVNADVFARAGVFDIWMANTDRRDANFLFEALPPGKMPAHATSCQCWLIDHGQCGLWPANKFEGRDPADIPNSETDAGYVLWDRAEQRIAELMPVTYRKALRTGLASKRQLLLDGIHGVTNDVIEHAVSEVPESFFTRGQAQATVAFLQDRRDNLCKVIGQFWAS